MWHSKHGNRKCGSRLSQSPCRMKARTRQRRPFVISPWKGDVFVGGWLPDHASTSCKLSGSPNTYEPESRPLARLLALWIPTDPNPIWQACHHPNTMTSQCRYAGELNEKDQNDQAQTSHTMELSKLSLQSGQPAHNAIGSITNLWRWWVWPRNLQDIAMNCAFQWKNSVIISATRTRTHRFTARKHSILWFCLFQSEWVLPDEKPT